MRKYSSLRWKLTALIAGGSVVAAVIAAAGFSWFDLSRFWQSTNAHVIAIANIVADQAEPAITLSDRKAAGEILGSLRADSLLRDAVLYDARGACFAEFHRMPVTGCPPMPPEGVHREPEALVFSRAVNADGERLGTLVLAAGIPSIPAILRQYLGGAGLIVMLSLVVAAVVAIALQSRVSAPILAIAKVAERIALTHRFEDRVAVSSTDELGVLAGSFNAMLDEIGRRDKELALHRSSLENQVAERNRVNAELRLAKEKAEDVARLKSEFLANMSHEIRTPMNGVMGMISLVLDKCSNPEEREQLLVAQNAANALVTILNDILDLSKIEAGKMTIETIDFDLRNTLREALQIFDIAVREKNLNLSLAFASECPAWVRGDPVRLKQVVVNLVGNAVKFTAEGTVHVMVSPVRPGIVRVEVRDTGIGIARAKLHSIFDAFTQADGSHTRKFGGTGLGLAITRRLVDLMDGRLWAESEAGRGSQFFVELPLTSSSAPAPGCDAAGNSAGPSVAPQLPPLRVLVAEDNPINQKVICSMLRRQGWTVTLAANGKEAYQRYLQERFDLVLMDIQMPEVDGLEAARLIRQDEARSANAESSRQAEHPPNQTPQLTPPRRTPIIALTAHASQPQHDQCIAEGMDGVITKPVNLPALLRGIGAVLICSSPAAA
jgi:signal transduction histidine kinase/AmiR/NasT family two-component response regulator